MTEQDIINIFLSVDSKADYFLYIFITLNLGVIGALFYFDKPIRPIFKIVFLAVYFLFFYIIYESLISDLDQMKMLQKDLLNITANSGSGYEITKHILTKNIDFAKDVWTFLSIVVMVVVIFGLFFPSLITEKLKTKKR